MIVEQLGRIPMSPNLAATLGRASDYAHRHAHPAVSLEHLLLALAEDADAAQVLAACRIDIARLYTEASSYLQRLEKRPRADLAGEPGLAEDLRRIIKAAAEAAQQGRRSHVNGAIVLAAILGDGHSAAAEMLRAQGVTFEEAIRALRFAAGPVMPQPATADEVLANTRARVHTRNSQTLARPPAEAAPHLPDRTHAAPAPAAQPASAAAGPLEPPASAPPSPPAEPDRDAPAAPAKETEPAPSAGADNQRQFSAGEKNLAEVLAAAKKSVAAAPGHPAHDAALPPSPLQPEEQLDFRPVPANVAPPMPAPQPQGWAPPAHPTERPPVSPGPPRPPVPANAPPPLPPRANVPMPVQVPSQMPMPAPMPGPVPAPASYRPPDRPALPAPPQGRPAPGSPSPERLGQAVRPAPPGPAARQAYNGPPQPAHMPQPEGARPPVQRRTKPGKRTGAEPGQLVENIPRKMSVGVTVPVEARIAKADVQMLAQGLQGGGAVVRHEVMVTRAMSVRLRAPEGGFWIETASPDTQWIESSYGLMSDDFASWRWSVTPRSRGRRLLQLVISARTVGADGLTAETALPDQVIEVRVRANYARSLLRLSLWVAAAVAGGLLARFGEGVFDMAFKILRRLISAGG